MVLVYFIAFAFKTSYIPTFTVAMEARVVSKLELQDKLTLAGSSVVDGKLSTRSTV